MGTLPGQVARGDLDLGSVAQELVRAEVRVAEGGTGRVRGRFEFLQGGGGVAAAPGAMAGTWSEAGGTGSPSATNSISSSSWATGLELSRPTLNDRTYTLPLLPVGEYRLSTKVAGFQPFTRSGLTLTVDAIVTVDITLADGPGNGSG